VVLLLAAAFLLSGCAAEPSAMRPVRPGPVKGSGLPPAALAFGGDPEALIGREAGEIRRALGPPQLVRRDAPAEIWQYRGESCVLDLFLYEEARTLRVAYLEARDEEAQAVSARSCLASVLAAQPPVPTS
jgi:hypothetical protein